jgi:anti-sigma regulatory factor (Ser/Thr protein kinase)
MYVRSMLSSQYRWVRRLLVDWNFAVALASDVRAVAGLRRQLWRDLPIDTRGREEVAMIVSELATNAILHGASPVYVQVDVGDEVTRVEVEDGFPAWCKAADDARGMTLVDGLACRWGVNYDTGLGKVVWAEIPTH